MYKLLLISLLCICFLLGYLNKRRVLFFENIMMFLLVSASNKSGIV